MGRRIKCPYCGSEFWVHGAGMKPGDEVVKCYDCNSLFNHRKQSDEPTGSAER